MSARDKVLVAIMNNPLDFEIAHNRHWYRIPTTSVDKWLKDRWPPQWLAFYQTKIFGQEAYAVKKENYFLDFAIYCATGKIDVETDGDVWHANPERAGQDNLRDNDVKTAGWRVLRFTTHQIMEKMEEYCLPKIVENIGKFGGVEEGGILPRQIDRHALDGIYQQGLFDDL